VSYVEESDDILNLAKIALADECSAAEIYSMAAKIVRDRSIKERLLKISKRRKVMQASGGFSSGVVE